VSVSYEVDARMQEKRMRTVAIFMRISVTLCLMVLLDARFVARAEAAVVGVDAIIIEPASPGPSTLCTLKVRLHNSGTQAVSYFRFNVKIDKQDVPTYKKQTYMINIEPGTADEVGLYNFYSPSVAKPFTVQVILVEAQWVQVKKGRTSTTTTPSGPVAGLPLSASLSVKMSLGK
jgi:hypothetical protein